MIRGIAIAKAVVDEAKENVNSAKTIYQSYLNDIANYEADYETIMTGSNEEIENLINSRTYTYQSASGDMAETINHNIKQVQSEIDYYKQAYQTDLANQDSYNAEKNQAQMDAGEKQLRTLADELMSMTSTTQELTPQQIEAWKSLANGSYDIYKEYVSKMSPEMQQEIQDVTGVVANNKSLILETRKLASKVSENFGTEANGEETGKNYLEELWKGLDHQDVRRNVLDAISNLAKKIISSFSDSANGQESGKNFVEGIKNGINNAKGGLFTAVWNLGERIVSSLNGSLDEHSPSKLSEKSGINFVQGAINGITSKEKEALNLVNKFGNNLINNFNAGFNGKSLNTDFTNTKLSSQVIDSTKTIFTTPQIVFNVQELDEAKLEQCFNYINRKFGSKY